MSTKWKKCLKQKCAKQDQQKLLKRLSEMMWWFSRDFKKRRKFIEKEKKWSIFLSLAHISHFIFAQNSLFFKKNCFFYVILYRKGNCFILSLERFLYSIYIHTSIHTSTRYISVHSGTSNGRKEIKDLYNKK